jgi:hypothetical protein
VAPLQFAELRFQTGLFRAGKRLGIGRARLLWGLVFVGHGDQKGIRMNVPG